MISVNSVTADSPFKITLVYHILTLGAATHFILHLKQAVLCPLTLKQ